MPAPLAWLAALALSGLGLAVSLLPRGLELRLGAGLGRLVLALGGFKSRIAVENIRNCLPELGPREQRRLLRKNYEHYGNLVLEYLHFFSPIHGHFRGYMTRFAKLEGYEHWKRASDKGKGVLFVSCHLGFWEAQASGGALAGIPLTVVTKVLKPAWVDRKLTEGRLSTGVRAAYHPGSIPAVMRALRKGESVAFMNDQYARPPMGLKVRFFGALVDTLSAVGPLAKRTGAAIVPIHSYRDAQGVTRVLIGPELDLGEALDSPERATQLLADQVEKYVRAYPEQWLWLHRRFKHVDWSEARRTSAAR